MGSDSDDLDTDTQTPDLGQQSSEGGDAFGDDFDDFEAGAEHDDFNDFESSQNHAPPPDTSPEDVTPTKPSSKYIPEVSLVCRCTNSFGFQFPMVADGRLTAIHRLR